MILGTFKDAIANPVVLTAIVTFLTALFGAITAALKWKPSKDALQITNEQGRMTILNSLVETLQKEIERRGSEIIRLEAEVEKLERKNDKLESENAALLLDVTSTAKRVERAKRRLEDL